MCNIIARSLGVYVLTEETLEQRLAKTVELLVQAKRLMQQAEANLAELRAEITKTGKAPKSKGTRGEA